MRTNTSSVDQQPQEKKLTKPFMRLVTKIQHKNFEPGEFVEVKERTYEEAIDCINNSPGNKKEIIFKSGLPIPR
jgi:hypothetical protein